MHVAQNAPDFRIGNAIQNGSALEDALPVFALAFGFSRKSCCLRYIDIQVMPACRGGAA
jgi:hypothetical protein